MRNSRFIPAKNRFMRKALGITSKVMLFGVLLSLFLFACVHTDTTDIVNNDIAFADSTTGNLASTYGNSGALTAANFAGGYPGTTIGGVWEHTESFSSTKLSSSNISAQTGNTYRSITIETRSGNNGFKFYKSDNEYYGDGDGFYMYTVVNYQVSDFLLNLVNSATVQVTGFTATFTRSGGGKMSVKVLSESSMKSAYAYKDDDGASFTSPVSTATSWSVNTNPNITLTSNSKYIALVFMVSGTSSQDAKNVTGEVYNMNLKFKVTLKDSNKPGINVVENKLTITDSGVGIKSVEIRRNSDDVKIAEFTSSTTWGGALTENTTTHRVTNPDFSDDTKTFTCDIAEANKYHIIAKDHFGNTLDTTFDVNPTNLILVSSETGESITIKGVITRAYSQYNTAWTGLTVPTKLASVEGEENTYQVDDSGTDIDQIIIRDGYGIVGWNSGTPENVTGTIADGLDATFVPSAIKDVTLYITWEEMFTLIYHNNNEGTDSIVKDMAIQGIQMSEKVIPDSVLSNGINKPTGAWQEFYKPGYYLSGWATTADATTANVTFPYTAGTKGTSVDIYAVWTSIEFSVEYNVGVGNGTIPTQTGLTVNNIGQAQDSDSTFDQIADNFFTYWSVSDVSFRKGGYFTVDDLKKLLSAGQSNVTDGTSQTITLTANWTGALEFGKRANVSGQWGSITNPYVISEQAHLTNLAALVNASSTDNAGVNSGKLGSYVGSPYATYTRTNAEIAVHEKTDGNGVDHYYSYAGAYFVLEIDGISASAPERIGNASRKFAGNFDGNNKTINFTYSTANNYVGLFAYIYSGGHVHDLDVVANITNATYQTGAVAGRNEGTISGCSVSGIVTSASNYVGGIVGYNFGTVEDCQNSAKVTGASKTGGIVGYNNRDNNTQAFIRDCTNTGAVSGTTEVGGIAGNSYGNISGCINSGSVTGSSDYVGGIAGCNTTKSGLAGAVVNNCINTATIKTTGGGAVAGIVGENFATVQHCVNKGTSITGNTFVGGVVGRNRDNGLVNYVFDIGSGRSVVGGISSAVNDALGWTFVTSAKTGKADTGYFVILDSSIAGTSFANVKPMIGNVKGTDWNDITSTDFTGFYLENITVGQDSYLAVLLGGSICEPSNMPAPTPAGDGLNFASVEFYDLGLEINETRVYNADITISAVALEFGIDWSKSGQWGSEENPYIIRNSSHLTNLKNIIGGTAAVGSVQGSTYASVTNPVAEAPFTDTQGTHYYLNSYFVLETSLTSTSTIGGDKKAFDGDFDGNGNTITLTIGSGSYLGLFGFIGTNGNVHDVNVTATVTGDYRVGGVAGRNDGTIENCTVTGRVNGGSTQDKTNWIGGIAGYNRGVIKGCTNSATITGNKANYVGGITGFNNDDSTNLDYAGNKVSAEIINCVSNGSVSNSSTSTQVYVGGVVGYSTGAITNCDVGVTGTVSVSATESHVGGVAGYSTGAISDCDVNANVSGKYRIGGVVGYGYNDITNCNVTAGSVRGSSFVGGIAGTNEGGTISGCINSASVAGNAGNKEYVGGIAGTNTSTSTITNCDNRGAVSGATSIGGIVGKNEGIVTVCDNTVAVTGTGNYTGGIVGYNIGTISGSKNAGTITGVDFVGGITGKNNDLDNYNKATPNVVIVTNCYNSGNVTGSGSVAGIAGENVHAKLDGNGDIICGLVQYCVNAGMVDSTHKDKPNLGTIVGNHYGGREQYVFSFAGDRTVLGGNSTSDTVVAGWSFTKDSTKVGKATAGYFVVDKTGITGDGFVNVKPMLNGVKADSWEDIVTSNFDGFYIAGDTVTVGNGNYLTLTSGGAYVSSATIDVASYSDDTDGTLKINSIEIKSFSGITADIIIDTATITEDPVIDFSNRFTYDGTDKASFNIVGLPTSYAFSKRIVAGGDNTINASETAEGTKLLVEVGVDLNGDNTPDIILGLKTYTVYIDPVDISTSNPNIRVFYKGMASGAEKVDIAGNVTLNGVYDITNGGMIDYNHASSTGGTFYIAIKIGNTYNVFYSFTYDADLSSPGEDGVKKLIDGDKGAISATYLADYDAYNMSGEGSATFIGEDNYTGDRVTGFYFYGTDFGRLDGAVGAWGTASNPYVISNWTHLIRLSAIVNGISDPIDSVNTGDGVFSAPNVVAKDIFFSTYEGNSGVMQCHFVVRGTENDLTIPVGIYFEPIGGKSLTQYRRDADGNIVSLSFFGGNIDGTNGDAASKITLGSALEDYTGEYSGLFGLVRGKEVAGVIRHATFKNIAVDGTTISGSNYVGSLIGCAERYVYIEYTEPYTNKINVSGGIITRTNASNGDVEDASFGDCVGGLFGYVGLGVQIYGQFENQGTVTSTGNYIGGFIGKLVAGAGKKSATNDVRYDFGDARLSFVNNGKVMASYYTADTGNYVGGIIGGTVKNADQDFSGVETIIQPAFMQNYASVKGTNYVGGFIGEVSDNVILHLTNAELDSAGNMPGGNVADVWSHNGGISSNAHGNNTQDGSDDYTAQIEGTASNVGGIVGKLSTMGHRLTGVFNTMYVKGGENNIGGLVGTMGGGTIEYSFVTTPSTTQITSATSVVTGENSVGGLVGSMESGNLTTSYAQGFSYGTTSVNRGGVAGVAQFVAKINNSWALYIAGDIDSVDHTTVAHNDYGKYILTYNGHGTATIGEMLVFAGLVKEGVLGTEDKKASSDKVKATKGMISLNLNLPSSGEATSHTTKAQLTFYDASGYEKPFMYSFDGAANDDADDAKNLFVRLNSDVNSSLIIAATRVIFGTINKYEEATEWESAYINIGDEALYNVSVQTPTYENGKYTVLFRTEYAYNFYDGGTPTYVKTSAQIEREYGENSEMAPYVIDSKAKWDSFAASVQGGKTYAGEYVKLAVDLTGGDKITKLSEIVGTTDYSKNFMGTFDGDGHTIEMQFSYQSSEGSHAEFGLFRGPQNATFKNLTITGTIKAHSNSTGTTGTNHIGGFVGRAHGNLTFENCTNDVDIIARGFSVGGFVGSTKLTTSTVNSYTFIGCVNTGNIVTYFPVGEIDYDNRSNRDSEKYGVGGFIGTVWNGTLNITYNNPIDAATLFGPTGDGEPIYDISGVFATTPKVTMESCRNAGDIYGSYNVGGLIGYNGGSTEVMNCGNTGKVTAVGEGSYSYNSSNGSVSVTPSRESRTYILTTSGNDLRVYIRRYLNAGGLVGLSTTAGHVDMYTSYNSGTVHAYGNTAGGLIGSDTEYTKTRQSSNTTKIYYCYNSGEVITGLDKYTVFLGSNKDYTDRYDDSDNLSDQRLMKYYENSPVMVDDESHRSQGSLDHWEMTLRHETQVEGGKKREGGSFGTTVGGIIGSTTNSDIAYCYNIGTITCRGLAIYTHGSGTAGLSYTEYHARAGGIVGLVDSGSVKVRNSYSVGDIKLEARHATTGSFSLENLSFAGLDGGVIKELRQTRPMYVAGIVGHDNANKVVDVSNCFSIKYQCHFLNEKNQYFRYHIEGYNNIVTGIVANEDTGEWLGWSDIIANLRAGKIKNAKIEFGTSLNSEDENSSSGYVVSSVAQLTAIMDARGIVTMPVGEDYPQADKTALGGTSTPHTHYVASATVLNPDYAVGQSDVRTVRDGMSTIKKGQVGGWIFIPGCLPQLAPFALDTHDGLAMTSYGYGQNAQGEYVKQIAGSEFNPYVIKDGIDLLGMSSLVAGASTTDYLIAGISFENKYIEFANGTNNLAGDVSDAIQLPAKSVNYNTGGNTRDHIFFDNGEIKEGKSYQLYNRAANGLHGVKGASNQTSQTRTYPATSIRATSQDSTSGAFNTDKLDSAYLTWTKKHYGYDGSKYALGVMFDKHNFNPIGYRGVVPGSVNFAFMGNISGALPDGKQTEILNLKVRGGYTTDDGAEKNVYAGLFGLVKDANISNITVMGEVTSYGGNNCTSQAGIVAKAYGNTTLTGLQAGTDNNSLTVKTASGGKGYAGGIVGHADSGTTGNRLVVENCAVSIGNISTHEPAENSVSASGTGGIIGYTQGADASSFTDVIGCNVVTAHIYSTTGFAVAGIIGNQGQNGAVAVSNCVVGHAPEEDGNGNMVRAQYTEDSKGNLTSGVKIQGEFALGGIIAYAFASENCTNSYTNCVVYDDVLIERTGHQDNNDSNKIVADNAEDMNANYQYGSAIGGVVGGILDDEKGKATFSGIIAFYGTIDAGHFLNNKNIGGVVGYMGTSARMEQCVVEIGGTITADVTGDGENIGGFAGISKGVLLDGLFLVHPTMNVSVFDAVGGFIGFNAGDTHIARTAIVYTTPAKWVDDDEDGAVGAGEIKPDTESKIGNIVANEDVGGFIGHNEAGKNIIIGVAEYKGDTFGTEDDYTEIVLGSSVDGHKNVGGFIGYNAGTIDARACDIDNSGHVGAANKLNSNGEPEVDAELNRELPLVDGGKYIGGVVGYIEVGGNIIIGSGASIINSGQVGHSNFQASNQSFVGGIIGASFGNVEVISNNDVTKESLVNIGSVYGYEYVGGAIGVVGAGTISGKLNNGTAPLDDDDAQGSAYEGSEALVAADNARMGTTASVTAVRNIGGVIGVVMQGATINGAEMNNYGTVTADSIKYVRVNGVIMPGTENGVLRSIIADDTKFVSNLGGVIGLHYGVIEGYSVFYNYGHITAENFAGGAIGVSDGTIKQASFVNYATIAFRGDTALGGAVGYITDDYSKFYPVITDGNCDECDKDEDTCTCDSFADVLPMAEYEYNASKNPSTIRDAYFSYEPMTSDGEGGQTYEIKVVLQATGITPYSGTAMGGLGGVFGVIDSKDITSDNWIGNDFFINGDVYGGKFNDSTSSNVLEEGVYVENSTRAERDNFAGTVDNVGGVVGSISNASITISNMLVYRSNVGGKNYVGGIIGSNGSTNTREGVVKNGTIVTQSASIYNCYNVYGEVWAVDKAGNVGEAGGIVGNVTTSAKTYASYWVKAYENEYLQKSTPEDIANTLDQAGAWTTFLTYTDYVNNIDNAQGEGIARDKTIEDITPEDLIVDKDTENEHEISIEEYLNSTGLLGTHTGKLEWSDYVDENGVMTVNGNTYTQNANGDWGTYGEVDVKYNTGAKDSSTGYYYIFAEDGEDYAKAGITVDHTGKNGTLNTPYNDEALNFWLIIANSPKTENNNAVASNNVHSSINNGNVVPGFINATAYTADRNGYYLYVKSFGLVEDRDSDLVGTTMYYDEGEQKIYVTSNAETAGNVMIFYKEYRPGAALEYNGFYRWATASEELNYDEDGELAKADRVDGTNYYTLNGAVRNEGDIGNVNEAKLVGKYDVNATIWTYSNDVKVILGSVDTTDENLASAEREKFLWEIKKRQVKVEYSNQVDCAVEGIEAEDLDKYTGEYNHYITVIASNIALSEEWAYGWNATHSNVYGQIMDMVKIQYIYKDSTYSVDNATHRMQMLNENEFPTGEEAGDALVVAYCVASTDGLVTGENTIDSGNLAQSTLFQIEYRVYAKKAGTYEVSAVAEDENHTTSTQGKKNLQINRRSIKMQFEVEEESSSKTLQETYEFDGGEVYRGVSKITLSNISPADLRTIGDNLAKMFSFTFEIGDKNVASKVEPKITINATSGKVTIELYTSDVGTYATALALVEGGTMDVAGSYIFPNVPKAVVAGTLYQAADDESGATSWEADWEITPFEIAVGTVTISGKEVIYDGKAHSVAYEASGDGNFSDTKTHGNETIQLKVSITFGDGMAEHVNAGTYTVEEISLGENQFSDSTVTRNGSKATSKNALDNYLIEGNVEAETDGDVQLVIHEREIRVRWNDSPAPTTSFVYSGSAQGLSAGDVVFEMNMKTAVGDADDWQPVGTGTINGSTITFSGLLTHDKPQGGEVSESVSFDIRDFTATDAGNYTATIGNAIAGVSGKNDAGDTKADNYSLESTPDDLAYTIVKSIIQVSVSKHNITGKVFDGNSVIYEALPTLNITSTNGGATACNVQIKNARYNQNGAQTYVAAYNVGKGYDVYLDFKFANEADSKNYTIATDYLILDADAEITPKGITITLNTTGGATATKIFDNSNLYATVESDGTKTVKSSGNEFKPGRGMTVEGFITSGITVEATFQEMGSGRSQFHAYVNDVYLGNDGKYYQASDGTYLKQLYIKMTGGDFGNYYIAEVKTKGGETLVSQAGTTATPAVIRVPDSRAEGSATEGKNFKVTITPYSIKAKYGNTAQSYAKPDNTFNLDWLSVYCTDTKIPDSFGLSDDQIKVIVDNGWMTDASGNPQKYSKYTRIAGRKGNSELGAYLYSDYGYEYCFNLRTQPTLIIGYFVKQQDGYGIGTMAGLLIATEYFKGNFTNEDTMSYDFVQTPIDINDSNLIDNLPSGTWNSWEELLSEVDYHPAGYVHNGTTYGPSKLYKDIQSRMNSAPSGSALREALEAELNSFEVVFEQLEGQGSAELQFVYWKAEEIVDGTQYKKFYLINNIDGILTDSDMEMLRGAFGTEFGVNWGVGTSFLGNVLFAEEGSAVIFNSSVFDKFKDEEGVTHSFDGTFNGMGYTIDHLNITRIITSANDGDVINVGMFESVSAPANPADGGGYVTGLNFRNLSIYVVDNSNKNITINVGAVVGYNKSTALMQDITVHGTISVRSAQGTVNVGGVIGYDETGYVDGGGSAVLEGAIVVATIRAEGATVAAGGIVGVMSVYQNTIKDVVSLSEIYVKSENANANGFVGTYKGVVDGFVQTKDGKDYEPLSTVSDEGNYVTSSAFMNAVFTINANNEYTRVAGYQTAYRYKYVKTYTDLYNGSKTAFKNQIYSDAVGQPYGLYDVVSEYNIAITAESKINTRGSMRLKDIVDIYVLGYGLTRTDVSVSDGKISSFKKETTSKYFHAIANEANNDGYKPDGTDGNPIKIAYQQHLSLLRMFNYMSFEIVGDIKMYTGYNLAVVDEAFTGKIDAKGHEVNFRNGTAGQMFVYQSNNGADTGAEEKTITYDWVVVDPQDEE